MLLHIIINEYLKNFAGKWYVTRLVLFESVLRDAFSPKSGVGVLVRFAKGVKLDLFDMFAMEDKLETIFGRSVDLAEKGTVHNSYRRKSIAENIEVVYAV
jgi:predicted nucleotidyltransferase